MNKNILFKIVPVLYIGLGIWIIVSGFREKSEISMKQTYNAFQECTYRQAYHIVKVYQQKDGKGLSSGDLQRVADYLEYLENEKNSMFSQINTFPSDMDEIKKLSANIFDESEILYKHFVNHYKDVDKDEKIAAKYNQILGEAIDKTFDCSIDRSEIRRNIQGKTLAEDFIDRYL